MSVTREHLDAVQGERVKREFQERAAAERAIERLKGAAFGDDQIMMTTHGAHTEPDGTFVRGGIDVLVNADERADDAERILAAD